jgi:hypothetical protein
MVANNKLPFEAEEIEIIRKNFLEYLCNSYRFITNHREEGNLLNIMKKARDYFNQRYNCSSKNPNFEGKSLCEYAIDLYNIPCKKKGIPVKKNGGVDRKRPWSPEFKNTLERVLKGSNIAMEDNDCEDDSH